MFLKFIEDFLTIEECEEIIKMGESLGLERMKSSLVVNNKLIEENMTYSGNKRMGCYFLGDLLQKELIVNLSNKIIKLSNDLNPFNGISYDKVPNYSFNRYCVDDFLNWHSDKHEILNGATITFVIQLNDTYEGGDVKYIFNGAEMSVPKKQGSVFIFDSNIVHSVDKVNEGVRYSINVWPAKTIKKSLL